MSWRLVGFPLLVKAKSIPLEKKKVPLGRIRKQDRFRSQESGFCSSGISSTEGTRRSHWASGFARGRTLQLPVPGVWTGLCSHHHGPSHRSSANTVDFKHLSFVFSCSFLFTFLSCYSSPKLGRNRASSKAWSVPSLQSPWPHSSWVGEHGVSPTWQGLLGKAGSF